MLRIGIVTDNEDPEQLRRVRVQSVDRGTSTSDWVPRLTAWEGSDLGVPPIGSTVVIADLDGGTDSQVVIGVLQTTTSNSPKKKLGLGDWLSVVAGTLSWIIRGDWKMVVDGTVTLKRSVPINPTVEIRSDGEIRLSNTLGRISLLPTGYLSVVDPTGQWTTGPTGMLITHPSQVSITSPNLLWNGAQVAIVGGTDTRGDTTLS